MIYQSVRQFSAFPIQQGSQQIEMGIGMELRSGWVLTLIFRRGRVKRITISYHLDNNNHYERLGLVSIQGQE